MITQPELEALRALWAEKCGGKPLPPPAAFDAPALGRSREHAGWVDVEEDQSKFCFRWIGAWLAARWNAPTTSHSPEDLSTEIGATLRADLVRALLLKTPVFTLRPPFPRADETQFSELILPLSSDGDTIDALLVAAYPLAKEN